ncbi:MAG: DUF3237 domain-containing protein [Polyangiales bacterium]
MTASEQGAGVSGEPAGPGLEFVFEARVSIAERLSVGKSKHGERIAVPIAGGTVRGPRLEAEVLPIGADFQLVRPDGGMELEARYLLRASDGALIHVHNRGLVHIARDGGAPKVYVRTVPEFEAPSEGPYAWLNHAIFVATLELAARDCVLLRFYRVG